ncbi:MAG TPA: hypothetical protein VFJ57_03380 [Solirubrobacterales bacterium]|nr:hypothetical protein [Solirubrobacterales bacterium]
MGATFHGPGEGEDFQLGSSSLSLKVGADGTNGTLFMSETTLAPGSFLCELAAAFADADGPSAPEQIGKIASAYDVEVVGPPLA